MDKTETTRFSHTIPESLLKKVRLLAEKDERSVTWFINHILKQFVEKKGK